MIADGPVGAPSPAGTDPQRILVAIDGSAPADIAVDLVADLPWPAAVSFRVVQAVDIGPGLFGGPWPAVALTQVDELEAALLGKARAEIDRAVALLTAPGRNVSARVRTGRAADVILDEARTMPADLVVVGSRGHGTIASMLLGSVSSEVLTKAPVPVLIARGDRIKRIVLAWDGSRSATDAVTAVRGWPILTEAEVRVVSVADIGMPWWTGFAHVKGPTSGEWAEAVVSAVAGSRRDATRHADELVAALRAAGRIAVADVREGDVATEIIAAAREASADLIVLGTHGRTGLARLTLGSVASNVTRHAPCSALVVRMPGTAGVTGAA